MEILKFWTLENICESYEMLWKNSLLSIGFHLKFLRSSLRVLVLSGTLASAKATQFQCCTICETTSADDHSVFHLCSAICVGNVTETWDTEMPLLRSVWRWNFKRVFGVFVVDWVSASKWVVWPKSHSCNRQKCRAHVHRELPASATNSTDKAKNCSNWNKSRLSEFHTNWILRPGKCKGLSGHRTELLHLTSQMPLPNAMASIWHNESQKEKGAATTRQAEEQAKHLVHSEAFSSLQSARWLNRSIWLMIKVGTPYHSDLP